MSVKFKTNIDGTAFNGITGLASVVSPVNGTAAVGTSTAVARQDHVHGTDTTRAPLASPTFTGNATFTGNSTFTGLAYQPYHAVSTGQYFFDSYNGDRNLRWYVQGAYSDIIRNQPYTATEYWDGSAWVAWTAPSLFDAMLDGQRNTGTGGNKTGTNGITNTTKKFRFEVTASTGWPTQVIFWVETSWVGFSYPGLTAQIEEFNTTTNTWTTPITTTFTTANSVTDWGLAGFVSWGLHNGYSKTRITLEFGTIPTTGTYTSVDIRNIMITSNFGGTSNILPFSTDYGKNVTFGGSLTVPGSVKLNNLTASRILELDASKNIISAAKQTGYNLALSTTATDIKVNGTQSLGSSSTLARADHVHPTDTSRAPTVSPTFTGSVVLPSATSIGDVSSTEVSYLDGVTSAIQTQFSGKANSSHTHDDRYYTETESDSRFMNTAGDTLTGTLNYRMLQYQTTSNYDTAGDSSGFSVFYGTGSATSKPSGTDHAVATFSYSDAWQTQLAMDWRNGGRSYIRGQNNGTWSGWSQLWSSADFANNSSNWNTAYGWGNHASASYATESYVGTQISNLVDSSPEALNTLNELAAALGDDANFSTTVTNSIATKAPLESPSFTGTVVLPSGQALIAPALGTVASGNIAACTGLPIINGTTGTLSVARGGTGVITSTGSGSNVLSTSALLTTPIIGGTGAVFNGSTSGTTKLVATAVAGTTTLTLPATSGTLATVGGEETLGGKTLESPVINSPTGLVKGDVGLGNVDNTADNAKNVLSATKLTSERTIGGVPFDGSANIPQRQVTHHSAAFTFAVNTKQYIGLLDSDSESVTASNINLPFLAPFNGKLLKIFLRSSSGLTGGDLTLLLEKNALGVAAGTNPTVVTNNPAAQPGPANSAMKTYDWTSLSNTINAGDMIFISIASTAVFTGVKIFFTCLWEWDH